MNNNPIKVKNPYIINTKSSSHSESSSVTLKPPKAATEQSEPKEGSSTECSMDRQILSNFRPIKVVAVYGQNTHDRANEKFNPFHCPSTKRKDKVPSMKMRQHKSSVSFRPMNITNLHRDDAMKEASHSTSSIKKEKVVALKKKESKQAKESYYY